MSLVQDGVEPRLCEAVVEDAVIELDPAELGGGTVADADAVLEARADVLAVPRTPAPLVELVQLVRTTARIGRTRSGRAIRKLVVSIQLSPTMHSRKSRLLS